MIDHAPVTAPPIETVTPIRPSEAIRLGCLIAPVPGTGSFFPESGAACALGAMALGFGYDEPRDELDSDPYVFVDARLPAELPWPLAPDEIGTHHLAASEVIYMLNDSFDWSRERIADWLESLGL